MYLFNNSNLRKLSEYYRDSKLTIIGGNDSLGVPCAVKDKNRAGFSELIASVLKEQGLNITYINAFSVKLNKTWHLNRILQHNLSLEEIKTTQLNSIKLARKGLIEKIGLNPLLKNSYYIGCTDSSVNITSKLKNSTEPTFFYSCGSNDLMAKLNSNPITAVINKNNRKELLKKLNEDKLVLSVIKNVENNFENILSINNETDIYCLSLYLPGIFNKLEKLIPDLSILKDLIIEYNKELKISCDKYGVSHINTHYLSNHCAKGGLDFHTTQEGHDLLAYNILDEMYNRKILGVGTSRDIELLNNFEFDDEGLIGMMRDAAYDEQNILEEIRKIEEYANFSFKKPNNPKQVEIKRKLKDSSEESKILADSYYNNQNRQFKKIMRGI